MRPSGLRQHAVVAYLTQTEAQIVEAARMLDGGGSPQPRSAWLLQRAVERLEAHATTGNRVAVAALVELRLAYRLMGVPQDGRKPARAGVYIAGALQGLADLAGRLGDTQAEAEALAALAALRAHSAMDPEGGHV